MSLLLWRSPHLRFPPLAPPRDLQPSVPPSCPTTPDTPSGPLTSPASPKPASPLIPHFGPSSNLQPARHTTTRPGESNNNIAHPTSPLTSRATPRFSRFFLVMLIAGIPQSLLDAPIGGNTHAQTLVLLPHWLSRQQEVGLLEVAILLRGVANLAQPCL